MTEPVNPVEVEAHILRLAAEIETGADVVSQWEEASEEATEAARQAYDLAWLNAEGLPTERRIRAEIATADLRTAAQVATLGFKKTKRRLKAAEDRLSAYQSVLKSVMQMYGASGSGRGH
ncbi:hypothetical protein [Pseudoclavibacter sp. AY1H1]|uniref:hypothetical protein n=1 Tax=Pseudoclavibacter sp. AY1H1 TaxID=2080584 RepID=UPI000CE87DFF|nr:hypothetical protein [Pseudoclavibacter sp. AY1H1]PPF38367.1 hypothetical protein C5E05_04970 [Pseudoclavibacter sp. AY1H1]